MQDRTVTLMSPALVLYSGLFVGVCRTGMRPDWSSVEGGLGFFCVKALTKPPPDLLQISIFQEEVDNLEQLAAAGAVV